MDERDISTMLYCVQYGVHVDVGGYLTDGLSKRQATVYLRG